VGPPTQNLMALARDGVRAKLRTAIRRAIAEEARVSVSGTHVHRRDGYQRVQLSIEPLRGSRDTEGLLLVSFADEAPGKHDVPAVAGPREGEDPLVLQLEQELTTTRE